MPAWGPTHGNDQIWGLVSLMKRLPELTPEGYRALAEGPGPTAMTTTTEPLRTLMPKRQPSTRPLPSVQFPARTRTTLRSVMRIDSDEH